MHTQKEIRAVEKLRQILKRKDFRIMSGNETELIDNLREAGFELKDTEK